MICSIYSNGFRKIYSKGTPDLQTVITEPVQTSAWIKMTFFVLLIKMQLRLEVNRMWFVIIQTNKTAVVIAGTPAEICTFLFVFFILQKLSRCS